MNVAETLAAFGMADVQLGAAAAPQARPSSSQGVCFGYMFNCNSQH